MLEALPAEPLYLDHEDLAQMHPLDTSEAPRVAVIITNFNYASFLPGAIESVLGQDYPAMEVVVVDDGSTDHSLEVLGPFCARGVRVLTKPNTGASGARNFGLAATTAPLVAFLDADDTWLPHKLRLQVDVLSRHPEVGVVSGWMVWNDVIHGRQHLTRWGNVLGRPFAEIMAVRNVVGNPSLALVRREIIERAGPFDPTLRWGNDWEFFARQAHVCRFAFLRTPLVEYRSHAGNLSHSRQHNARQECLDGITRRLIAQLPRVRQRTVRRWARAHSAFAHGRLARSEGMCMTAAGLAIQALVADPGIDTWNKLVLLVESLVGREQYASLRCFIRKLGQGRIG